MMPYLTETTEIVDWWVWFPAVQTSVPPVSVVSMLLTVGERPGRVFSLAFQTGERRYGHKEDGEMIPGNLLVKCKVNCVVSRGNCTVLRGGDVICYAEFNEEYKREAQVKDFYRS
jgi:hypothetical protein